MLSKFIDLALNLKDSNEKISHSIAKELAFIELSLLWHSNKHNENILRLKSLIEHIKTTFPNNDIASELIQLIKHRIILIRTA